MPVRKFRSIEEMNEADRDRWLDCDDPRLAEHIGSFWAEWGGLIPPLDFPKGVHKFRSIEEMNAFRERYEDERIARIRAERVVKK